MKNYNLLYKSTNIKIPPPPPSEINVQDLVCVWFWEYNVLTVVTHEGMPVIDRIDRGWGHIVEKERTISVDPYHILSGLVVRKGVTLIKEGKGTHWVLKSIDTFDILVPEHGCVRVGHDPYSTRHSIYKMTPEQYGE